jgi:hypothetical protein
MRKNTTTNREAADYLATKGYIIPVFEPTPEQQDNIDKIKALGPPIIGDAWARMPSLITIEKIKGNSPS